MNPAASQSTARASLGDAGRPFLRRATAYFRWALKLSSLGASRWVAGRLVAAAIVSLLKSRIPLLCRCVWTANLRLGSRRVNFHFRDRSELRALEEVFIGDEDWLPPRVRSANILDLGANVGQASLFFRTRFPGARILAVEPDPATFELLRRNVGADPDIEILNCAVTAAPGPVRIISRRGRSWASTVVPASGAEPGTTVEAGLSTSCSSMRAAR